MPLLVSPVQMLQRGLVAKVRSTFNDQSKGQQPIPRSADALFAPDSVIWRVHGDVTSMMVGGISALLLQMLHPAALAGVYDHSDVERDQLERLRRTARFIAVTTYGERDTAMQAIERVRSIHRQVSGATPAGAAYRADDPALLAWVHVGGALMFLGGWVRYGEPRMTAADRDRYFAESGDVAAMLGADPVPRSEREALALVSEFRPQLAVDQRTHAFRRLVVDAPVPWREVAAYRLIGAAALDLLPDFARRMHGVRAPLAARPLVRAATATMAGTLRWAFAAEPYR